MAAVTINDIRRANLALLSTELGSKRKLAETIGKSEAQLSQWINGSTDSRTGKPRGMRLETCHQIEDATGKPRGWLDTDHSTHQLYARQEPPPYQDPITEALSALSVAIAAVPDNLRQELADDMRQWALYGRDSHRNAVAETLKRRNTPSRKRDAA